MIECLIELGFTEEEINDFQIQYQDLLDFSKENLNSKISILENFDFTFDEIKNIILTNPIYLNKTDDEILNLINILIKYGINDIRNLVDINPYILSLDAIDIENYFITKTDEGVLKDDIIDSFFENTTETQG